MLDVDSATDFLLEQKLIDRAALLDGDLIVSSTARRNRNLRVEGAAGIGYLIKQPDDFSHGSRETLRREAAFYAFCLSEPAVEPVTRLLPLLRYYDPRQPLLALELLGDARLLHAQLADEADWHSPLEVTKAVGMALALVHRTFRHPSLAADPRLGPLGQGFPWAMTIHKPSPEILSTLSAANYELLKILQSHAPLGDQLSALRQEWKVDTLIHNDIRSDNILIRSLRDGIGPVTEMVRFVDWELVQLGDPAWDVAGFLQDLVFFWINSIPFGTTTDTDVMISQARFPWSQIQGLLRSFWEGYTSTVSLPCTEASRLLLRAVRFSAARQIQTAYELAQTASHLPPQSVLLLQISANILNDAETAQAQFFGIPQGIAVVP
jgi:hypothetical protein